MSKKPNHYTDVAVFYDYDATDKMNLDIPFYLEIAEHSNAVEVLDLCCGTGRVALEFVKKGYNVTALDISQAMLDVFKGKLAALDNEAKKRLTLVQANATSFELNKKFDLIVIPYRSFQQFASTTDANNCLKCVHRHLSDNGTFVLSCYRPVRVLDSTWAYPKKTQWKIVDKNGNTITKNHWGEKIDIANKLIYPVLCYEVCDTQGNKEVFYEDLTLKYYYHQDLVDMLHETNFAIIKEYGDYQKNAVETSTEYIFVCKKNAHISSEEVHEVL